MYEMRIQYNILNCTQGVDKMIEIFKKYHPEIYDVPLGKGSGNIEAAEEMEDIVSNQAQLIMHDLFGW